MMFCVGTGNMIDINGFWRWMVRRPGGVRMSERRLKGEEEDSDEYESSELGLLTCTLHAWFRTNQNGVRFGTVL
jgi:hypothetical protein